MRDEEGSWVLADESATDEWPRMEWHMEWNESPDTAHLSDDGSSPLAQPP
jgi:hypothetical protein